MFSSQLFNDIIRNCSNCNLAFDDRLHSPYILRCAHTFCVMCLTNADQKKKNSCFECGTKYKSFSPNLALIEAIQRIDERKKWMECEMKRCDECDNRVPFNMMRQCETCELEFQSKTEFPLQCVVCLECCVNSHNGHELIRCVSQSSSTSISGSPMLSRPRKPSTSSMVSVRLRDKSETNHRITAKGIINTIRSWSFRSSTTTDVPYLLTPSSKFRFSQEDIVMESQSPFFEGKLNRRAISMSYNDNISLDSVFEGRTDSPQNTIMASTSTAAKYSPKSIHSANDSGIFNTPSPLHNYSKRRVSLSTTHLDNSAIHSNISTPSFGFRSKFGTVGVRRNRIRMGVSDIMNSPRRSAENLLLPCSTPIIPSRSENSIIVKESLNSAYGLI